MSERLSGERQMEENASLLMRLAPSPVSRRRLLLGGGVGALAVVAAACGSDDEEPAATGTEGTAPEEESEAPVGGGGDVVATAKLAAGLEVLAVNTYGAALEADLDYPPAVAEFATTVRGHHEAARDAWNELLTNLGEQPVTTAPPELEASVNEQFGRATDVPGVAELALMLEEIAADTYFDVIPTMADASALQLAATIQPVDMQHIAILNYVLGEYPVPRTFADAENSAA